MKLNKLSSVSLGVISLLATFNSHAGQADKIHIQHAYTREVPPNAPATGSFMTIMNHNDKAVKLVKASSDLSDQVELHTHTSENGVMRMREVKHIAIPSHGTTELKPGGYHIMLIGPKHPIKTGQKVELTLTFEDGSEKSISTPVKPLMNRSHQMNHNHDHHQH